MRRLGAVGGAWLLGLGLLVDPVLISRPALAQAQLSSDGIQLKIRRLPDAIELVLQDAGMGGAMEQRLDGAIWVGELRTDRTRGLKAGPQSLAMPDAGMERITFDGTGRLFQLKVTPSRDQTISPPIVSSDGKDLIVRFPAPQLPVSQTVSPNLSRPTAVPTPAYVPPLRPRAVAPPLGDMAVGSMTIRNRGYVNLSGPPVTLTTRGANARDVLMVLAQMGGYGYAYSDPATGPQGTNASAAQTNPVTVAFQNEAYERAFNFVLLSSGLQARREGNTIMVGPNVLSKTIGPQLSKVYRLNQVSANSAADYIANLGASVTKVTSITTAVSQGLNQTEQVAGASATNQTVTSTQQQVEAFGASTGPLVGLQATTDPRLSTITLVGEPALVAVAEQYLKQLDLRQRQVALSVKILDVTLNNDTEIDNSFAFRFGNNFIVNDGGRLLAAFGRNLPANSFDFDPANTFEVFDEFSTGSSTNNRNSDRSRNRNSGSGSSSRSGDSFDNNLTLNFQDDTQLNQSQVETINAQLSRQTGTTIEPFEIERTFFVENPNFNPANPDSEEFIERTVTNREFRVVPNGSASQSLSSALTSRVENIIGSITGQQVSLSRGQTGANDNDSSNRNSRSRNSNRGSDRSRTSTNSQFYSGLRRRNPGLNYPDNQFFDFLQAQIVSNNTKVLAAPTLILSENPEEISGGANASSATQSSTGGFNLLGQQTIGRSRANESFVTVGTQVITALNVTTQENSTNVICEPEFATAGLAFGARVSKIDDNGFVTFSLTPTISAIVDFISGPTACSSDLAILSLRRLDTGSLRVRDGQTLILTGVISDEDQQAVSKWPILGDLPIVGQFFRRTSGSRRRNELVILVTPRIIDDEKGGTYGYGYTPGTQDARRLMYGANN
ncbi:secretin N-terminal domain-containing protein [Synechococcus sp. CCY9202]|uniref:secretin N-terminal domain-containing protein n=1 Tax=Synechococcus sp. CCY9202 TaxID=174698 RepID=UPI002B21D31A|nr:secretin N-terminal domain-containing protein [Synechococcus sp. CCY9202]